MATHIELTREQSAVVVQGSPCTVTDPQTSARYYLVPADEYDKLQEILEDEEEQRAIHDAAYEDAIARMRADE